MSDALERLRNRQRPEVPARDTALISRDADVPVQSIQNTSSVDTSTSRYPEPKNSSNQDSQNSRELKTKQSTMRLEAEVSDRLQEACRVNGLSREVLIEALFLYCEADSEAWQAVIDEAKQRAEHRQQIANLRRAQSMMEKFGSQLS